MLTRFIYPLTLREKISNYVQKLYPNINDKNVPLEFNKKIKFDLSENDIGYKSIIFNGFYQLDLSKALLKLGSKGGLLIDVGANYGYFSCLWAAQNSKNMVLAFEAFPIKLVPLKNNVFKNKLDERIKIIPLAIGKEKGKLNLSLELENKQTCWGAFIIKEYSASVEVDVETLDSYMNDKKLPEIEVLIIDIEGIYLDVLYGAKQLLTEKRIKHIFYGQNHTKSESLDNHINEAKIFLEKFDYVVEQLSPTAFYSYGK